MNCCGLPSHLLPCSSSSDWWKASLGSQCSKNLTQPERFLQEFFFCFGFPEEGLEKMLSPSAMGRGQGDARRENYPYRFTVSDSQMGVAGLKIQCWSMIVLWVVEAGVALAASAYLCLFPLLIPAWMLMLPCGELDLGTEQKPDLISTWISSMIWFTGE